VVAGTSATIASTIGTARAQHAGRGGLRLEQHPLVARVPVSCSLRIVAVGLNAARTGIGSPFEIPPCTPPERFVRVRTRPSSTKNASLCSAR
jgi:hypothetical protein